MIDPTATELQIERVGNGWIIRPCGSSLCRRGALVLLENIMVARSPEELSELLFAWALKQQDQPVEK